jgi:hypothetical protein
LLGVFLGVVGTTVVVACIGALSRSVSKPSSHALLGRPPSPFTWPTRCPPLRLNQARVVDVATHDGRVVVAFDALTEHATTVQARLLAGVPEARTVAILERWCAEGTALLLLTDDLGDTHVLSRDGAATGVHLLVTKGEIAS